MASLPDVAHAQRAVARAGFAGRTEAERTEARRVLNQAKIADSIRANVDKWPPLTEDQRAELALLLTGEAA